MPTDTNLRINGTRLWDSLMTMAKIGATPNGGVNRLTLTQVDGEARALFAAWCEAAGLTMSVDKMGSMFARRAGHDDSLPPVMVGSHLDSQPTGGKFDGALGTLAALELVRTLNDLDITTKHPIEIVNFTNEEGSRFAPAMVASGVFAGHFDLDYGLSRADADGVTLGEALQSIGYAGEAPVGKRPVHAFFELHIEQGPVLEEAGIDIGVVTKANGQYWYEVTLTGVESHAGPTPMNRRKDAGLAAARIIEAVNAIGHRFAPDACATVGMCELYPASRNVIPGRAWLTIDVRHPDADTLAAIDQAVREAVEEAATRSGVASTLQQIFHFAPLPFNADCVSAVRDAATTLGYSHRDMTSGAGHDAVHMAPVFPTGMVFTPCVDGISHNEAEDIKPAWATAGCDVLLHAVLETAQVVTPAT